MTWNYRIFQRVISGTSEYSIHEVYYSDDGSIEGWTESVGPSGESLEELMADITYFLSAFIRPVLEIELDEEGKERIVNDEDCEDFTSHHFFEVMDRSFVSMENFIHNVASHPVVRKDRELDSMAEELLEKYFSFYQVSAKMFFDKDESTN